MRRLTNVTLIDQDDDPRARRVAEAAIARGLACISVNLTESRPSSPATTRAPRELRGIVRLARLGRRTIALIRQKPAEVGEVVHAHDFDSLPASWLISRRSGARLVYDAHELYTGFDRDPPRVWLRVVSLLEGTLSRRATAVVTVSEPIADALRARHRLPVRPYVVMNCPPLVEITQDSSAGPLRVIYQASAGPGRYLHDLVPVSGVELSARVLGATDAPPGIRLLEPVAPSELVRSLVGFDVGVIIDRLDTENARLALPNKLFEYLMAGLAVAVPDASTMAELVRREGVGVAYPEGGLGPALAELAGNRPRLEEMRRRARTVAVERYNAEAQRPLLYQAWGL